MNTKQEPFVGDLDLTVRIGEITLPNPVGVASGTLGYGSEYDTLIELNDLGALYTKAVTPEPRMGNDAPRIVETPSGMLNSIGLANPGLDAFIRDKLPELRKRRCPVIVNVAGSTERDYMDVVERLEAKPGLAGYEINVSCPNVSHGGMAFGTNPALVESLTRRLRALLRPSMPGVSSRRALIVKLSPNVTDIAEIARAAEAGGADALSCVNTLVGMVIDVNSRRPALARGAGGLSGPAIRPVGVACVYRVSRAVQIPVIGVGGILSAQDALQYLLAGAVAVQIGTANFVAPETAGKVLAGIRSWMSEQGAPSARGIRNMLAAP